MSYGKSITPTCLTIYIIQTVFWMVYVGTPTSLVDTYLVVLLCILKIMIVNENNDRELQVHFLYKEVRLCV